ncbi:MULTISPECIES: deoxyribose-phosphate aldolase [unclassified Azospirillum]|uniref:deoxyribose-phosphate aldolase n=1 Tax=unclassified Azospirillum TaxID=2630922 RepID=UPI000B69A7A5|nr:MULTISPECIES: deoxyribose-phosphate aldolase [unclassified Azospirillum]SNS29841.1 deoxyribose-phosphate aldolase [Azospirillum sp. RU38E]SNS48265.1 deoxyribose-phosphate aldolase [Azospirillum sp. RU37A]
MTHNFDSGIDSAAIARRCLPLLDLTSLNDTDDAASTVVLCAKAVNPVGNVAAVCLWPSFVSQAKQILAGTGVKVATVVNFPGGSFGAEKVAAQIAGALADGADEIDVVMNYADVMMGDGRRAAEHLAACRVACGETTMKVILESGSLAKPVFIERAAAIAVAAGADFLKTSTGKVPAGATPSAARIMLEAAKGADRRVGFKASGGIRDLETAAEYLALADQICGPGWVGPDTFRFGASGLLDAILGALGVAPGPHVGSAGY